MRCVGNVLQSCDFDRYNCSWSCSGDDFVQMKEVWSGRTILRLVIPTAAIVVLSCLRWLRWIVAYENLGCVSSERWEKSLKEAPSCFLPPYVIYAKRTTKPNESDYAFLGFIHYYVCVKMFFGLIGLLSADYIPFEKVEVWSRLSPGHFGVTGLWVAVSSTDGTWCRLISHHCIAETHVKRL